MQATVYNIAGEEVESIELDDTIYGIEPNTALIHQAVLRQIDAAVDLDHRAGLVRHGRSRFRAPRFVDQNNRRTELFAQTTGYLIAIEMRHIEVENRDARFE